MNQIDFSRISLFDSHLKGIFRENSGLDFLKHIDETNFILKNSKNLNFDAFFE